MNKTELRDTLKNSHRTFIEYIRGMTIDEFEFSHQTKWSAGQQLKHIVLCIYPVVQVFGMPNTLIKNKFGLTETNSLSYEKILTDYLEQLNIGGKAPSPYVPGVISENEKEELLNTLSKLIDQLNVEIERFTEKELDTLCIPHPLLKKISLREMLYNVIYHVKHHQNQTKNNLNYK
ncbi:hypothetical protein ULMA_00110 [Patiriisocius marinus]|uniref:DinB-like domain-containing protein n=1 Tax=Patiriisocius marinus TaxID=1397112 RepID=A0A5J4IWU5_9FLAO|nr:DinB family protein [Patiriisocius marinus]GER57903.1 hypothetical protein ULMA_00110 [Patiriisocius marinus]